jgi:hypothetical protein
MLQYAQTQDTSRKNIQKLRELPSRETTRGSFLTILMTLTLTRLSSATRMFPSVVNAFAPAKFASDTAMNGI